MKSITPDPETCRSFVYQSWLKNPPGAMSDGFGSWFLYSSLMMPFRAIRSFAYCSALTLAPTPVPLSSLPWLESQPIRNNTTKGTSSFFYKSLCDGEEKYQIPRNLQGILLPRCISSARRHWWSPNLLPKHASWFGAFHRVHLNQTSHGPCMKSQKSS